MSTLEVSNLNDGTTTVATTFVTNGSAKTWCQWSGASAIRDSLNVSSIADIATGSNTLTYTTNFANDDYAGGGLARENSSGGAAFMRLSTFSSSITGILSIYSVISKVPATYIDFLPLPPVYLPIK